jgi:tetratricopeptide (TPR) repeat protein
MLDQHVSPPASRFGTARPESAAFATTDAPASHVPVSAEHGRQLLFAVLLGAAIGVWPQGATAASALDTLYGRGVHQFFRGDATESIRTFSDCIDAGSRDPRVYYFRGLALAGAGRSDEAEADFSQAARIEAAGAGSWDVGRALERIQGPRRYLIEKHRLAAKVALARRGAVLERPRLPILTPPAAVPPPPPGLLRVPKPVPDSALVPAPADGDAAAKPADDARPTDDAAERAEMPDDAPPPKKPKAEDPFGDDPFGN